MSKRDDKMPKIQRIGSSLAVTIPFYIAKIKGWQKGQELVFNIDVRSGKVVLDKLEEAGASRIICFFIAFLLSPAYSYTFCIASSVYFLSRLINPAS